MRRKFTKREWKKSLVCSKRAMRKKRIYVVSTEDSVILDFQITNNMPSCTELLSLFKRVKNQILKKDILKIVSDKDSAIVGSVKKIFPNKAHSFCVFHPSHIRSE